MPRLGRNTVLKVSAQQQLSRKEETIDVECEHSVQEEWTARGADQQFAEVVFKWLRQGGSAAGLKDPGPLQEILWRHNLRARGMLAYMRAGETMSYKDACPISTKDAMRLMQRQLEKDNSVQAVTWKEELVWARVSEPQRRKAAAQYIFSVITGRPHGFSSVGRLLPQQAMARLLLHGLQIFMTTALDAAALQQLHSRHCSALAVQSSDVDMFNTLAIYTDGRVPLTFTGQLPPSATEVPLFDYLSLHWQLHLVAQVMSHLIPPGCTCVEPESFCSHSMLPADQPYTWAAFNKLLLLGMYAPIEEAHAGMQQVQLVMLQQHELAQARKEDSASACRSMQQTLTDLRHVLQEQLHVELNAAQAAFQLFAAQPQHPPGLAKQLQQQMMNSCQLSDLWTLSNSSSSSSSSSSPQHRRDFILSVMCALLAWPLLNLQEVIPGPVADLGGNMHSDGSQEGLRQRDAAAQAADKNQPAHLQTLLQLLHLAVPGYGNTQHNRAPSGIKDTVDSLPSATPDTPEQQEQQALLTCLLEVVRHCLSPGARRDEAPFKRPADSNRTEGQAAAPAGCEETMDRAAAQGDAPAKHQAQTTSSDSDSTRSVDSGGPSVVSSKMLQLQSFTRGACHLLLVRLLSAAPPCEEWPWEVCVCVAQLVVAVEQVICASGQVAYNSLEVSVALGGTAKLKEDFLQQARQQQQQQQDAEQQQQAPRCSSPCRQQQQDGEVRGGKDLITAVLAEAWNNKMQLFLQQYVHSLSCMMSSLRKAEAVLQDLQEQVSHCSSSSSTAANCASIANDHPSSESSSSSSSSEEFSSGSFWRRQTLNLYRETRSSAFNWIQKHFDKFEPSNDKPGFWGLIGRFAAREQLNLRHAQAPAAAAATPLSYTQFEDISMDQQSVAILSQQLARIANGNLANVDSCETFPSATSSIPVQPIALKALMGCACIAAQQPQVLSYATPKGAALAAARQHPVTRTNAGDSASASASCVTHEGHGTEPQAGPGMTSAPGGLPPTCQNAAAAANAACGGWRDPVPFHLSTVAGLAPLFDPEQQGPCLVRFMQLLLQYHTDCTAAARAAVQRLAPALEQQQQPWTPSITSTYQQQQQQQQQTQQRRQNDSRVPAEGSRLLVLLMGLYHMSMLKEHHERQQLQQQQKAMQAYTSSPGHSTQQGVRSETAAGKQSKQKQQRSQKTGLEAKDFTYLPAASAAAADASKLYADAQLRYKMAQEAAGAAYSLQDLLWYCLAPLEALTAHIDQADLQGAAVDVKPDNSSSSSTARFEVCEISKALMIDGMRLMCVNGEPGASEGSYAPCDHCVVRQAAAAAYRQAGLPAGGQDTVRRATAMCSTCSACEWCAECAASPEVHAWHGRFCHGEGGPFQAAVSAVMHMATEGNHLPGAVHEMAVLNVHRPQCACDACQLISCAAPPRLAVVCELHPLSQNRGMGISQASAERHVLQRWGLATAPGSAPTWEDFLVGPTLAASDPSTMQRTVERFLQPLYQLKRYSMAAAAQAASLASAAQAASTRLWSRYSRSSLSELSSSSTLLRDQEEGSSSSSAQCAATLPGAYGAREAGLGRSSTREPLGLKPLEQQQQQHRGTFEDSQTQQDQRLLEEYDWSNIDALVDAVTEGGLMGSPSSSSEVDLLEQYFKEQQGFGSRFEQLD